MQRERRKGRRGQKRNVFGETERIRGGEDGLV